MGQLKEELVKHIDEAHAMEQNVLRMLDGMIATTDDPEILDALEHHKVQTQGHADRMAERLEAHEERLDAQEKRFNEFLQRFDAFLRGQESGNGH